MRCDSGYSLNEDSFSCDLSPLSLKGCEMYRENNECVRPKADYMLIKNENN